MDAFLQQFQHLKIQLEEIKSATDNFNDKTNWIGGGGFGKVYKGEVTHSKGRSMAAIKRLDPRHGQGIPEFLKEITTLSRYSHENLISLLGYGYQGDEIILVYEHASRGSLDRHLDSPHLTWPQRLKICRDAAKGLSYLHDPRDTHQRLIHCDVKSANILLDDQWNGKVADFGLSIMGPANEQQSVIVTAAVGTPGYYDPQYATTHTLTKESDVYSFGVVLFEVLCGTLCCKYSNGRFQQILVPRWIESYKQKQLNNIIYKNPAIQPLDQSSLEIVSDIAYRCLKESREDRPKMAEVVTEIETAIVNQELLESQDFNKWKAQLLYYEEITKTAKPPLNYRSHVELMKLLNKGVLLNDGKTWFSVNKEGEHCEMVSIVDCLDKKDNLRFVADNHPRSFEDESVNIHVKTQFLSPLITYTVNLVFMFRNRRMLMNHDLISLKYKLQGETKTSSLYLAHEIEDGSWTCELYRFTSDDRIVDLQILLGRHVFDDGRIEVKGIEFRPLEKVEHEDVKQPISDSDANWEENLPTDYENIMKWSKNSVQWTTKKEVYSTIRKGFLINEGQEWFSLDKNGKKCLMLSTSAALRRDNTNMSILSIPESRFGEAFQCNSGILAISSNIKCELLSSQTRYATYLVYKLPEDQSGFEVPLLVVDKIGKTLTRGPFKSFPYLYLVTPQTPLIRSKTDQNTQTLISRPKIEGVPQQRNDGWMELQIWEFETASTNMISMCLELTTQGVQKLKGLIIEGIELRPM